MSIKTKQHIAAVQLDALTQMRDELNEEIERLERVISGIDDDVRLPTSGTFTAEITTAIHDILVAERPLKRQAILERLAEQAIYVGGKDSLRTLSAYLSNDDRFHAVPGARGMWTLVSPPAAEHSIGRVEVANEQPSQPMQVAPPPELLDPPRSPIGIVHQAVKSL